MKIYSKKDLKDKKKVEELKSKYYATLNDAESEEKDGFDNYIKSKNYYNTLSEDDKTKAAYYSQNTPEVKAEKEKNRQKQIRKQNSNNIKDKIDVKIDELRERAAVAVGSVQEAKEKKKKDKRKGSW